LSITRMWCGAGQASAAYSGVSAAAGTTFDCMDMITLSLFVLAAAAV